MTRENPIIKKLNLPIKEFRSYAKVREASKQRIASHRSQDMNEDRLLQPDRRASGTSNLMTSGGADINVQTMFLSH